MEMETSSHDKRSNSPANEMDPNEDEQTILVGEKNSRSEEVVEEKDHNATTTREDSSSPNEEVVEDEKYQKYKVSLPQEPSLRTLFSVIPSVLEEFKHARTDASISRQFGSSAAILQTVQMEYNEYQERLLKTAEELQKKLHWQVDVLEKERDMFDASNKAYRTTMEDQLLEKSMRGKPVMKIDSTLPHTAPLVIDRSDKEGAVPESELLVNYWRTQHQLLSEEHHKIDEELVSIEQQMADVQMTAGGEHYKLQCMVGLLREKEATEREKARMYRVLLRELQANDPNSRGNSQSPPSGGVRQGSSNMDQFLDPNGSFGSPARGRSPQQAGGRMAGSPEHAAQQRDAAKLSVIEQNIAELEGASLDNCLVKLDAEIAALRVALTQRNKRQDALKTKIKEAHNQPPPHQMTIDVALEAALDLRSKVADSDNTPPPGFTVSSFADNASFNQHTSAASLTLLHQELSELVATLEVERNKYGELETNMEQAMRERRVQMIRALHMSSSDPDARFTRLKSEQCVSVVGRQIALAEDEKRRLLAAADASAAAARANAHFLRKVE